MEHVMNEHGVLLDTNKHHYEVGKKKKLTITTGLHKGKWYAGHDYQDFNDYFGMATPISPKYDTPHSTEQDAIMYELEKMVNNYNVKEASRYLNQVSLF